MNVNISYLYLCQLASEIVGLICMVGLLCLCLVSVHKFYVVSDCSDQKVINLIKLLLELWWPWDEEEKKKMTERWWWRSPAASKVGLTFFFFSLPAFYCYTLVFLACCVLYQTAIITKIERSFIRASHVTNSWNRQRSPEPTPTNHHDAVFISAPWLLVGCTYGNLFLCQCTKWIHRWTIS